MARSRASISVLSFNALSAEGNLISPAMLKDIASISASEQAATDYALPRGVTLRDELARYFRIGQATFQHLHGSSDPSVSATTRFVASLLSDVLGFTKIEKPGMLAVGSANTHEVVREFPITLQTLDGRVPVVVVPPSDGLDATTTHLRPDGRRRSAASAVQDWLNASDAVLWGLCCNGLSLRLLRDNHSLTRPAFIEFDLTQIFANEDFASFTLFWLLLHSSRFGQPGTPASDCPLERWRDAGAKIGQVALAALADNVHDALLILGNGFLRHPGNNTLRERLKSNGGLAFSSTTGEGHSFFSQLLRLIYRLIFLLAAEDRELLHPSGTDSQLRNLYAKAYSLGSLRDRAVRRAAWDAFDDRWEGLKLTFRALAHGEPRLGLPALGGLFDSNQTPDLDTLALSNRDLFAALYHLAWLRSDTVPVPVNWRDMQTEELGSVYEGLLELTPRLDGSGRGMSFAEGLETKGNERKTSGSYYTPDSLVQTLLDSALDPVLDRLEVGAGNQTNDPAAHLLSVTVIDPACGSGHFLLAAARRIATRVAQLRKDGVPSQDDYRIALRDVVRLCIYGVDRNPMAVELTRVALWIETVEPGKPLGFLDANIRCGDALLGVFSLDALSQGIPEAAYKPLVGDDKQVAKVFSARNKEDLKGQGRLGLFGQAASFPVPPLFASAAAALRSLPEESEQDILDRAQAFARLHCSVELTQWTDAADLYIAGFLATKNKPVLGNNENPEFPGMPLVPVSSHVWKCLEGGKVQERLLDAARELAGRARAFHWPLEFPHILLTQDGAHKGFDVVLGNPPWEVLQLSEEEYFTQRVPQIATLPGAKRKKAIQHLEEVEPSIYAEYVADLRAYEAMNEFARESGRFDLSARGKVNTYSLFSELFASAYSVRGRAGIIVPTGIATDSSTAEFFGALVNERKLAKLIDFENREGIFPGVHRSYKFCLLTLAHAIDQASFTFFLGNTSQLAEEDRSFVLSPEDIVRINPNTKTSPVFRSKADAALTAKFYTNSSVLIDDTRQAGNPWQMQFRQGLFNMTSDSRLFHTAEDFRANGAAHRDGNRWVIAEDHAVPTIDGGIYLPLYESKLIHHFDHRWATYDNLESRDVTPSERCDSTFEVTPRYWVHQDEVAGRLAGKSWHRQWLLGWRDICRSTDERTVIAAAFPRSGCGDTLLLMFPTVADVRLNACLLGNLVSLSLDYASRQKIGGTHMKYNVFKQLPVLPPTAYDDRAFEFIIPRVLELTYTSYSMQSFARDLGCESEPYSWDEKRRALLRAELDAWYARAYGLTRDDLRYILDPADLLGLNYPSETFRVLKSKELKEFGEYRTQRLVLAAWDRQAAGEIPASEVDENRRSIPVFTPVPNISYEQLLDKAWAIVRPEPYKPMVDATRLLAAILMQVQSASRDEIGVIYAYASKPSKLTGFLSQEDRLTWLRLIGDDAQPLSSGVIGMPDRPDLPFEQARSWLTSRNAIIEDLLTKTWTNGGVDTGLSLEGWPEGRARFVTEVVRKLGLTHLLESLTPEERVWEVKIA